MLLFYTIRKKICIKSILYGNNSFLFVNATNIYKFKVKISEIKDYALCLGNISKDCTAKNMKKGLKGVVIFFLLIYILLILTIF